MGPSKIQQHQALTSLGLALSPGPSLQEISSVKMQPKVALPRLLPMQPLLSQLPTRPKLPPGSVIQTSQVLHTQAGMSTPIQLPPPRKRQQLREMLSQQPQPRTHGSSVQPLESSHPTFL